MRKLLVTLERVSPFGDQALASLSKKSHKAGSGTTTAAAAAAHTHAPGEEQQEWLREWKSLLCSLIADKELKSLRHDAKRLLRRLCVTQASVVTRWMGRWPASVSPNGFDSVDASFGYFPGASQKQEQQSMMPGGLFGGPEEMRGDSREKVRSRTWCCLCFAVDGLLGQAAYHGVRDSYQFTAELGKVLEYLPPSAARAACEMLRNPPGSGSTSGRKRARDDAIVGSDGSPATDDEDELPYTTQVSGLGRLMRREPLPAPSSRPGFRARIGVVAGGVSREVGLLACSCRHLCALSGWWEQGGGREEWGVSIPWWVPDIPGVGVPTFVRSSTEPMAANEYLMRQSPV